MKTFFQFLLFLAMASGSLTAQDVFKQELFATEQIMKYRADIDLSAEQADQVKRIYAAEIGGFNSLKWDLDAAQNELSKLLSASKVDRNAALANMRKVTQLEEQLKQIRLAMLVDIKNVLSEEQQKKLKELRTSSDMNTPFFQIASINENPRMVLKVNGAADTGLQPLYVLVNGGKKTFVTSTDDLNPNDIESVNVLKGEAAKAIYGDKGKNGVVVITMKQ